FIIVIIITQSALLCIKFHKKSIAPAVKSCFFTFFPFVAGSIKSDFHLSGESISFRSFFKTVFVQADHCLV
ncbi:hypothetical protein, partial [Massilicoli timonensis]|uniref:hypothetical protein n=1 Tax=Massilicoli timonensis TaxID=2015901 RepID=UPI003AAB8B74